MDTFYHRTNNLDAIATSGRVKALKHLATNTPDLEVEVEPGAWGSNLGGLSSSRSKMLASEAYDLMKDVKDVGSVFLSKEVLPSLSYGKYVIEKSLRNPKRNTSLNLIANEYITPRELSVRHNATVYVPKDELSDAVSKYKGIKFRSIDDLKARNANLVDHARTLYSKITKQANLQTLYSGSEKDVRKILGPNATIVGSEGLGISIPGKSDRDILVPYSTKRNYDNLVDKLRDNGMGLQESEYNSRKRDGYRVYSYKDGGIDVDVALVHGGNASKLADKVRELRTSMTDEARQGIIDKKTSLQNAWFFKDKRYKNYKRNLDKQLGLTEFHE